MESLKGFPGQNHCTDVTTFLLPGERMRCVWPRMGETEHKEVCTWIPLMPFPLMIWPCNFTTFVMSTTIHRVPSLSSESPNVEGGLGILDTELKHQFPRVKAQCTALSLTLTTVAGTQLAALSIYGRYLFPLIFLLPLFQNRTQKIISEKWNFKSFTHTLL